MGSIIDDDGDGRRRCQIDIEVGLIRTSSMAIARPAHCAYGGREAAKTQLRLNGLSSLAPLRTIFVVVCAMGVTGCAGYPAQRDLEVRNPTQRVVRLASVRVPARVRLYSKEHQHAELRERRAAPSLLAPQPAPNSTTVLAFQRFHRAERTNESPNSSSEPADASPRKESAPRKQAGTSDNRYTAGLVSGVPHSTEFAIAQEIATALASDQGTGEGEMALRLMPMVGNGGSRNILDILTLAGADMAITPVIVADRLRKARTREVGDKLVYIAPLFIEEFHLLARPEIRNVTDLAGKTVNLGEKGSAGAVLGREVLNSLDVKVTEVNLGLDVALEGMRNGQISATLLLSGKPVNFLARNAKSEDIRLLPIPYSPVLQADYLPSTFRHEDYPNLIAAGESVDTIGIKSALYTYNWPVRSERFRLLELFVQTFFSRFSEFLDDAHHPKWRELNLAGRLPGWQRFRPAEQWLQRQALRLGPSAPGFESISRAPKMSETR
jgi:uncharacterized protein